MRLSQRVLSMTESSIRKLTPLADAAKGAGKRVYHLNIGQPDLPTPEGFFKGIRGFEEKVLSYAPSPGLPQLREVFSQYYQDRGLTWHPRISWSPMAAVKPCTLPSPSSVIPAMRSWCLNPCMPATSFLPALPALSSAPCPPGLKTAFTCRPGRNSAGGSPPHQGHPGHQSRESHRYRLYQGRDGDAGRSGPGTRPLHNCR